MTTTRGWMISALVGAGVGCGGPQLDTRTFEVRYANPHDVATAIDPYVFTDRDKAPGSMSVGANLITVRETPDNLAKIERLLAEHDRPQPSVRLHFKVIQANGAPGRDTAIADVEQELRRLFRFQGYRLLGEALVVGIAGSDITQLVGSDLGIHVTIVGVRGRGDRATVQLNVDLWPERAFSTSVTAPVGQTVVLGNAHSRAGRGVLILTVRPEVVN